MATSGAADARLQPASSTSAFAPTRASDDRECCSSIFNAPLCLSPDTRRIPTNGSRNAAASSHALNVGAQTPTSGKNASPAPIALEAAPLRPLTSAYVRTAPMNETPTSGPMSTSITHQARDDSSSRHSFSSSHSHAGRVRLRERKEYLFEAAAVRRGAARSGHGRQLVERAFAADASAAQQHEAIADSRGIGDLMNRQHERAAPGDLRAQRVGDFARLPQIEAVERFVREQNGLRREQAHRQERALALALRERAHRRIEDGFEIEARHDVLQRIDPAAEESQRVIERPADRLRRPRRDRVGQIKEDGAALVRPERAIFGRHHAAVRRQHTREALEERRLARPVRTDDAEHFAGTDREGHVAQRGDRSVAFGEMTDSNHNHRIYRRLGAYYQRP